MKYDVIIIGAGAAGLFAAASIYKGETLVIERNESAGKKLLVSGGGRCNFTNLEDREGLIKRYFDKKNFVKPAIFNFPSDKLIEFFNKNGLKTVYDVGGRVFPASMNGLSVLQTLLKLCKTVGSNIVYSTRVIGIERNKRGFLVVAEGKRIESNYVIIATGGKSYPVTGSTGDGYGFAEALGHKIIKTEPALTPIVAKGDILSELAGISLKNKNITVLRNKESIAMGRGDLLFTHTGLSGPVILNLSRFIQKNDMLEISLMDLANRDELTSDIKKRIAMMGKKEVTNIFGSYNIPRKLILFVLKRAGVNSKMKSANLKGSEIKKIVSSLFPKVEVEGKFGFKRAMLTRGGVSTEEINAKNMESRIVKGLYFVGEVMDVDGESGGYNLQFAFSSAKLATDDINRKIDNIK